jgi:hypothetical protein
MKGLTRVVLALILVYMLTGCSDAGAPADVVALIEAAKAEVSVANMDEELDSVVQYERMSGRRSIPSLHISAIRCPQLSRCRVPTSPPKP